MRKIRKVSFSRRFVSKVVVTFAMTVVVCIASFATALANTVSTIVTDGDNMYTFSMDSTDLNEIIQRAETMGLKPLGPNDICERVDNTTAVNVRRGVNLTVNEAGNIAELIAYKGDTLEKALADNGIVLKDKDKVNPAKDTVITQDLSIELNRYCTVTVLADGKTKQVSLMSATVGDALKAAGVTVGTDDAVNYPQTKALVDNMRIRVTRVISLKITADGESKMYKLSADNVENAIVKAGLKLGTDDIVTPMKNQKVTEGMEISIQRVVIKEDTRTEDIDFNVQEETDSSIYPEDSYVKTDGVKGQKEAVVKQYFIEGKLEKEEIKSETVKKEPVNKVIITGTKEELVSIPSTPSNSGKSNDSSETVNGRSYSRKIEGRATAYAISGTTANGMTTQRGLIAVDPSVIPYGTRVYIETPGYSGEYIAADTGGAMLSGNILVDIWMASTQECLNFGVQNATVYILD